MERIEESAFKLKDSLEESYPEQKIFINTVSTAGDQPIKTQSARGPGNLDATFFGSHLAECVIELAPGEERPISTVEISKIWRDLTGPIPGVKQVEFESDLFSTGPPIEIKLSSVSREDLKKVT